MIFQDQANQKPLGLWFVLTVAGAAMAVLSPIAWFAVGSSAVIAVFAGFASCLPGLVVFALSDRMLRSGAGLLVSTFLRMGSALGVCVCVREMWPSLGFGDFYLWLAVMYLVLLAAESHALAQSMSLSRKVA